MRAIDHGQFRAILTQLFSDAVNCRDRCSIEVFMYNKARAAPGSAMGMILQGVSRVLDSHDPFPLAGRGLQASRGKRGVLLLLEHRTSFRAGYGSGSCRVVKGEATASEGKQADRHQRQAVVTFAGESVATLQRPDQISEPGCISSIHPVL